MAMRLDKFLSNMGVGTRSEVKKTIRFGKVIVNGDVVKSPEFKVDESRDRVEVKGQPIGFKEHVTLMLNKPAGVLSATEDSRQSTVLDLIKHPRKSQLFPVGRLDKDTEGLLLLTTDGQMAHELLSPKKHVPKIYYAKVDGLITLEHKKAFKEGLTLKDGYQAMPADLNILSAGDISECQVVIYEGKFHQVKKMFEAVGGKVTYLKRLQMGGLKLDESLALGTYKELNEEQLEALKRS